MGKKLFICNTYYQLIVAIQMKLTIMADADVDIIITDRSRNSVRICEKVKEIHLFDKVYYHSFKEPKSGRASTLERIYYVYGGTFGNRKYRLTKDAYYDEICCFNFDLHAHFVYEYCARINKDIRCSKYEEGFISYASGEDTYGVISLIYTIRRLLRKSNMRERIEKFYCFNPNAYKGVFEPIAIPRISEKDRKIKQILFDVFLKGNPRQEYSAKYIYLPCIYDIEGGEPIGELSLAIKVAELVGRENLIVKVHPRDNPDKYKEQGLRVAVDSASPWEAVQINGDFSQKVLLSTVSGSLLTTNVLFAEPPKSHYLYNLCDLEHNPLATYYSNVIRDYVISSEELGLKNITECESLEEILN